MRDGEDVVSVSEGDDIEVVLDRTRSTPKGRPAGDHGTITTADGSLIEIFDVQSPVPGLYVHRAGWRRVRLRAVRRLRAGRHPAPPGDQPGPHRDPHDPSRLPRDARRHGHPDGLGERPGRLRFDFPSPTPVPASVPSDAEALVNDVLRDDLTVTAQTMPQAEAVAMGRHGAVRREVRRKRTGRVGGRLGARVVGGTHAARSDSWAR